MTGPGRDEELPADGIAARGTLRARREKFLAESSAEYDVEAVDDDEVAQLLGEARRRYPPSLSERDLSGPSSPAPSPPGLTAF